MIIFTFLQSLHPRPSSMKIPFFHLIQQAQGFSTGYSTCIKKYVQLLPLLIQTTPVSITRARTFLWKSWKHSTNIDGVTARWLDEMALRSDPIVKPYWKARDSGRIHQAIKYLRKNGDAIMAS